MPKKTTPDKKQENPKLKIVEGPVEVGDEKNSEPKTDYSQYGYRTSETVPIPSVLFYKLLGLTTLVEKENYKVFYEDRQTIEETFSDKNTPVNFLSPLGMEAKALRYQLNQVHISNVDNGIATPIEVLQKEANQSEKPAVTLEDNPPMGNSTK